MPRVLKKGLVFFFSLLKPTTLISAKRWDIIKVIKVWFTYITIPTKSIWLFEFENCFKIQSPQGNFNYQSNSHTPKTWLPHNRQEAWKQQNIGTVTCGTQQFSPASIVSHHSIQINLDRHKGQIVKSGSHTWAVLNDLAEPYLLSSHVHCVKYVVLSHISHTWVQLIPTQNEWRIPHTKCQGHIHDS